MPEPEKTRRIVQVAVGSTEQRDDTCVALCNDGSLWILVWGERQGDERWARLPDIPQS